MVSHKHAGVIESSNNKHTSIQNRQVYPMISVNISLCELLIKYTILRGFMASKPMLFITRLFHGKISI